MKLHPISQNQTEVFINRAVIFFSYGVPVACLINNKGYYKTDKFWNQITTRHINSWTPKKAQIKPQHWFDELINSVKLTKEIG